MTQTTLKKATVVLSLSTLFMLYQNFDFSQYWKAQVKPIDEQARREHARELLGKFYAGSWAERAEDIPALHMSLYNEIYRSLPKKFKGQASALATTFIKESEIHDFDPVFVVAVIKTESSFNPLARGGVGEIGLMQLRPETAEWVAKKFKLKWHGKKTLENPVDNVRLGIAYLDYLREKFDGYANKYLSAYNMGASKVRRMYAAETKPREYSRKVMRHYKDTYARIVNTSTVSLIAKATEAPYFVDGASL
ncbi:MAG: lytic transglycosylase domain-containing protein [Pseudobdellovibrionaceae bacterium]